MLDYADNMRTKQKEDYRVISKEEFDEIDKYFQNNSFWRLGVNNYPKYRLLFNLLYFCGLRVGECIALTYNDFEEFSDYKKGEEKPLRIAPTTKSTSDKHLQGMRVRNYKKATRVSDMKPTQDPKNFKKRTIPLSLVLDRLFMGISVANIYRGQVVLDERIFGWTHGAC